MSKVTALAGFKDALRQNLVAVQKNWEAAVAGDEDAVHDLRIALRRSRAVLHIAKGVVADDVRASLLSELKWLAASTSDARDLDVALSGWEEIVGLEPVLNQIRARQRNAHAAMRIALGSDRARALLADWASVSEPGPQAMRPLRRVVGHRLKRAHRRLLKHEAKGVERHQLRKDAKSVRYIVESFADLFPSKRRKKYLSRLRRMQNDLGRTQDIRVQLALLESVVAESEFDGPTLSAVNQLTTRLHDEANAPTPRRRARQLKRLFPK